MISNSFPPEFSPVTSSSNPGYEAITSSVTADFPSKGCSTCRYFESSAYTDSGTCHRYPRAEMVSPSYWCGEWVSLHGMFTK